MNNTVINVKAWCAKLGVVKRRKVTSKRLVIDASIAKAAGTTEAPTSQLSRDFLCAVLGICHKVVMTPDISKEWQKHQTKFAKIWLRQMIAKKKLSHVTIADSTSSQLRAAIQESGQTPSQVKAMLKDVHLLEAALATDKMVASADETVRKLFSHLAGQVASVKQIMWVNPSHSEEAVIDWLKNGARVENPRLLSYPEEDLKSR
jgi:hypothetical protein